MHKRAPGIGLAVSPTQATITCLKKRRGHFQIMGFGSIPIPAGTADAGLVNDPAGIGHVLAGLVEQMGLKGKKVVSSIGGPQLFIRNIILPRMKLKELKEAAFFEATTFLPIPIDEAAIDVYPIRHYKDEEGEKSELFFVAVRRQQVDDLRITCETAGLDLVAVDLDPIALHRIIGIQDELFPQAYLYMGASRSCICVLKSGALIFQRYFSTGTDAMSQSIDPEGDPHQVLFQIDLKTDHQYLIHDLINETSYSLEYFRMQFKDELKTPLILCGPGARIGKLADTLTEALEHQVLTGDVSSRLLLSAKVSENERQKLAYDYLISLGLAAREVI